MLTAFISHAAEDVNSAMRMKKVLADFSITAFLAHQDISVSQEWRKEIFRNIRSSDVFIAVLSAAFKASDWASQEVGVAISRSRPKILIVPMSLDDTMPFGFISHLQGSRYREHGTLIAEIVAPIVKTFPRAAIPIVIARAKISRDWRYSEELLKSLLPLFSRFADSEVVDLVDAAIENAAILDAAACATEYLPRFIDVNRSRIPGAKLEILRYQIEKRRWYNDRSSMSVLDETFRRFARERIDFEPGMSNSDLDQVIDNVVAGRAQLALQGMAEDAIPQVTAEALITAIERARREFSP
jgi:hypothetical protein